MAVQLVLFTSCSQNREKTNVSRPDAAISVSIHYSDGLEASSLDDEESLVFNNGMVPIFLRFTNTSDQVLTLWKPYCPQGDRGIAFEFKLEKDSKRVEIATPNHGYTGGMGFPKTLRLEKGKSLILPVDFGNFWSVPFALKPGKDATLYFRFVYESRRGTLLKEDKPKDANVVWEGRVESEWQLLRLVNVGKDVEPRKPSHKVNLLSRKGK